MRYEFVETVFRDATGLVRLSATKPGSAVCVQETLLRPREYIPMRKFVDKFRGKMNVWIDLTTVIENRKQVTPGDVVALCTEFGMEWYTKNRVKKKIQEIAVPPSIALTFTTGACLLWVLRDPLRWMLPTTGKRSRL